jgi:nucleotide-binding universal stress UspA family protein
VLEFALAEAARRGAALDVICALPDLRPGDDGAPDAAVVDGAHRWFEKYPSVTANFHIRHGIDPAIALMVDSHTAQLVVVGSGADTSRTASASVAHALVHRAACPVAVVPATGLGEE